jgi:Domain of unknown function (DUF4878)
MKKLFLLTLVAFSLLLAGCGSPKSTAESFTTAVAKGRIVDAKQYCTESSKPVLDMAMSMGAIQIDPNFNFQLVGQEIRENRATVSYRNGSGGQTERIDLVKIDGKWLVEIHK